MLRPVMWTKWCFCLKKIFPTKCAIIRTKPTKCTYTHTHTFHPPIESLCCSKWIRLCGKFSGKSNLNAHKWLLLQYINDRELNSYSRCRHIIWWNNNRCSSTVICNGILYSFMHHRLYKCAMHTTISPVLWKVNWQTFYPTFAATE